MAYKVTFDTYAIIEDQTTGKRTAGNVVQSTETIYTDRESNEIEGQINAYLEERKRICYIKAIERVPGKCLI